MNNERSLHISQDLALCPSLLCLKSTKLFFLKQSIEINLVGLTHWSDLFGLNEFISMCKIRKVLTSTIVSI